MTDDRPDFDTPWVCLRCGLVQPDTHNAGCDACLGTVWPRSKGMTPGEVLVWRKAYARSVGE